MDHSHSPDPDHNPDPEREFAAALSEALEMGVEDGVLQAAPPAPAPRFELKNVSHMHDAIMNWMLLNPHRSLGECAAYFGITRSWLSVLIHSNAFQARLKEKQDQIFSSIAADLPTKLTALAEVTVDKLTALVEESTDPRFIHEATKTALAAVGFGPARGTGPGTVNAQNVQQNFYVASPADLEAARSRIAGGTSPALPAPENDNG